MARQVDKSYYLLKLFEAQVPRTDPELSPDRRHQDAAKLMDELVGPRWREEVNAEVELVPNLPQLPSSQEVAEFWAEVQQAGYDAGFGVEDVTHSEPLDKPDPQHKCAAGSPDVISRIKQILGF